jgi:hypothetical protein
MKIFALVAGLFLTAQVASAQVAPTFQFGLKGGFNLSKFSTENTFASENKAGAYGGVWTRIGGAGIHLQPELYVSGKNTTLQNSNGLQNEVTFTSLDLPVLVGTKIGAAGIGVRLNTGPVASFVINEKQSFDQAASNVFSGNFKDQAFAWQFGAGVDVGKLSVDLRYELGLSKLNSTGYPETKLNLFMLGLGIRLF